MSSSRFLASALARPVLLLLVIASGTPIIPCLAATILTRQVDMEIRDGDLFRTEELLVLLDTPGDEDKWSRYPIWLNKNVTLEASEAVVLGSSGKSIRRIPRRKNLRQESTGDDLYTSSWSSNIPLDGLQIGQKISISYTVKKKPYFPADLIGLTMRESQQHLEVNLRGGGENLAWHIDVAPESFQVTKEGDRLQILANDVPALARPGHAPGPYAGGSTLHVSWGPQATWADMGNWYENLTRDVPGATEEVRQQAQRLVKDLEHPREKVEALTRYVKTKVRYEAVEIGVGGYVPTPSGEVMSQAWGDCKDKAELLRQMLAAVGLPSHMVLLRSGRDGRIHESLPSPFQFNHAILAVPAAAVDTRVGDPVFEGFLMIDPTWETGDVSWLPPADRGRMVLVVDENRSRLVKIDDLEDSELFSVKVDGEVTELGDLEGQVVVTITGVRALAWLRDIDTRAPERTDEDLRGLIQNILPGAQLFALNWDALDLPWPAVRLTAAVRRTALLKAEPGRRSFTVEGLNPLPATHSLENRTVPVALPVGRYVTELTLSLPEQWCPVSPDTVEEANDIGRVSVKLGAGADHELILKRALEIYRSRIEPDAFELLGALATEFSRANKRRIRLRCS